MAYVLLLVAILTEVVGTSLLPATHGYTRLWPTVGSLVAYAASILLLARVVTLLPTGWVYAVWSGVGTVAIVAISVAFLGESISVLKVVGVGLVVSGVVILNLGGAH